MKFRILSDLHLEFGKINIPVLPDEKQTTCILAGDIGIAVESSTYYPFVESMSERFNDVLYVLGNHEYYKGDYDATFSLIKNDLEQYENVTVIGDDIVVSFYAEEKLVVICSTLWTSMDKRSPITMLRAGVWIKDYHIVKKGNRKLTPDDTATVYEQTVDKLFTEIKLWKDRGWEVVVVTHHAPSQLSIAEQYKGDALNGAFYSNLEYRIIDLKPKVWIHGHVHDSFDYMLGDTRVICNARGYVMREMNGKFDPCLTIKV